MLLGMLRVHIWMALLPQYFSQQPNCSPQQSAHRIGLITDLRLDEIIDFGAGLAGYYLKIKGRDRLGTVPDGAFTPAILIVADRTE